MSLLLERDTKLKKSEYENLYEWALQEFDENGQEIGSPQIPTDLNLWFTSTEIIYKKKIFKDDYPFVESQRNYCDESELIFINLKPGVVKEDDKESYIFDDRSYSFFGTDRKIDKFNMYIKKLDNDNDNDEEGAISLGIPSYESGGDFDKKIEEDYFQINLFLNKDRFDSLVKSIERKAVNHIEFSATFPGFYSDWEPSTFYGMYSEPIKILSNDAEQVIDIPEELDIEPPKLGESFEFHLEVISPTIRNPVFEKLRNEED